MRLAVCLPLLLLTACTHADREQTREDAAKLGHDIKQGAKKADQVVTKELKETRDKVQKQAEKINQK